MRAIIPATCWPYTHFHSLHLHHPIDASPCSLFIKNKEMRFWHMKYNWRQSQESNPGLSHCPILTLKIALYLISRQMNRGTAIENCLIVRGLILLAGKENWKHVALGKKGKAILHLRATPKMLRKKEWFKATVLWLWKFWDSVLWAVQCLMMSERVRDCVWTSCCLTHLGWFSTWEQTSQTCGDAWGGIMIRWLG